MSKHTPGPWRAETDRRSWGGSLPPQVKAGDHIIASVEGSERLYTPEGDDTDGELEAARDEANARLIASAPGMAAEIQALKDEVARLRLQRADLWQVCKTTLATLETAVRAGVSGKTPEAEEIRRYAVESHHVLRLLRAALKRHKPE